MKPADAAPPATVANSSFSAVLLAGGRSRRMGVDKATLTLSGVPLWQRQLATLRALHPSHLFISGPADGVWAKTPSADLVPDLEPNRGPLGGLVTVLSYMSTPWLLVLAVDLPMMKSSFLQRLVQRAAQSHAGVVPSHPGGLEPLAAVYSRAAIDPARRRLASGEYSLKPLVLELEELSLAKRFPVFPEELPLFRNANTPQEWQALKRQAERS